MQSEGGGSNQEGERNQTWAARQNQGEAADLQIFFCFNSRTQPWATSILYALSDTMACGALWMCVSV